MSKKSKAAKPDKYDRAVKYLKQHPEQILNSWYSPDQFDNGCLFQFASRPWIMGYQGLGCLTQIRAAVRFAAATPALTQAIRKDIRIPKRPSSIKPKHLPVFAEWQRRLDRELRGKQNHNQKEKVS